MRVCVVTHGTRGDVQPMLELAAALRRRGHQVRLGVPVNQAPVAGRAGFDVVPLVVDTREFLESPEGRRCTGSANTRALVRRIHAKMHQHVAEVNAGLLRAAQGADVIVSNVLLEAPAACLAEAYDRPFVAVHICPLRPTRAVPNPVVTTTALPIPGLAMATHRLFERLVWAATRADVSAFRTQLGLPPTRLSTPRRAALAGALELQVYSRHLVPGLDDWPSRRPLVGCLTHDPKVEDLFGEAALDPELDAWLSTGPPPVFLGLGSIPVPDPDRVLAMVTRVTAELGLRAVVSAGWSRLAADGTPDHVRVTGPVSYALLLPRCALAVHNGGIGTTAAGLRAGLPTMVCSVAADQPFWGRQVARLGVGEHVPLARLDADRLRAGLRRLRQPAARGRAERLGQALRAEDDAAVRAAELIEEHAAGRYPGGVARERAA
jgi:sterol 3beta-glucosyltransferase